MAPQILPEAPVVALDCSDEGGVVFVESEADEGCSEAAGCEGASVTAVVPETGPTDSVGVVTRDTEAVCGTELDAGILLPILRFRFITAI